MTRWFPPALLLIIAVALAFRLPGLDQRPMHNDEGVNAIKFRALWEKDAYRYDPKEFHGPTLPYATLLAAWLGSSPDFNHFTEATFRIVPAVLGVGLILLLVLLADGLGRAGTLCAAALTALSPVMVYYSRYYIHEMLLVFSTLLVLAAGWRYSRTGALGWCLLAGLGLGLMYATKETFLFAVFALGAAVVAELAWERWIEKRSVEIGKHRRSNDSAGLGSAPAPPATPEASKLPHGIVSSDAFEPIGEGADRNTRGRVCSPVLTGSFPLRVRHLVLALLAGLAISLLFFTSFFTNASGPLDSIQTYSAWINRAGGDSPHTHPWFFYFRRLLFFHYANGPYWTEALILILAIAGAVSAFRKYGPANGNAALVRTVAFYSVILAGIYTVIPYKTPWCALGFWHGTILLAGVGAVALVRWSRPKWLQAGVAAALLIGAIHLGWQAWRANFVFSASPLNPYVYAHTSPDVLKLADRINALSRFAPDGSNTVIKVMSPGNDFWPLPWYLRNFKQVGWWGRIPPEPYAPLMIVSSKLEAAFDARPDKTHLMAGYFQLRPQVFLELYVDINLWREYVKSLPPEKD